MKLFIVESPTKIKTIKKFLGKDYEIMATLGHIRDLPERKLGVDAKDNFKPKYVLVPKKKAVVTALKKASKKADQVYLAMDLDREGEAIAWHTAKALGLGNNYQRIVFNEITQQAILKALKSPRKIDQNLVDAQQARRILDRIVGYKLSPLLWYKIAKGLSAGRVQSVALRLVADREKEIKNFIPQEYWTIAVLLAKNAKDRSFKTKDINEFEALLSKKDNKVIPKKGIENKEQAEKILDSLKGAEYRVESIQKKEIRKSPLPPFITSTLQQESWQKFHWPAEMTMRIAQKVYEKGYITYHRSDSLNLAKDAMSSAKKVILKRYGKQYLPESIRKFKTKSKRAQEAHEAIRPAHPEKFPDKANKDLDSLQMKMYDLIWRRFISCQMAQAIFDATRIEISAKNYRFSVTGQTLRFDGFLKVYPTSFKEINLPVLGKNEILVLKKITPNQHFTKPPARYTDASLIKKLEKNEIGRPSTYANIISVIQKRNYVAKNEQKRFYPREIGIMVNDLLVKHFPKIVDINFTAQMEENLDKVAQGKKEWVEVLKTFYEPFMKNLRRKTKEIQKHIEKTEKKCPECGSPLLIKISRFGKFYGCSNYPKCKFTKPFESKTLGIKCPKCKIGEIIEKRTRKGKIFFGCNKWPKCDFALWDKPTGEICPKCKSLLVKNKRGDIVCSNKDCNFTQANPSQEQQANINKSGKK